MKKNFLLLLLLPVLFACHKEKHLTAVDYLVVGYANLSWGKNCEAYKITPDAVFADSSACTVNFNTPALAAEQFQIAKSLLEQIPAELLQENQTTFRCESCNDTGGHFIEFQQDGVIHLFSIDDLATGVPEYLQVFNGRIQQVLDQL